MLNNDIAGAPGTIRTSDPQIRSLVLDPAFTPLNLQGFSFRMETGKRVTEPCQTLSPATIQTRLTTSSRPHGRRHNRVLRNR
jgi:hypothetical protein